MLGRHDIVAPEKRELVLQAVRELEYVPVKPVLQNRHVETHVIAVPIDDPRKLVWGINSGTFTGMCEAAMRHGYDVTMLLRPNPDWAAEGSAVQLLDRRSDGIVFASPLIGETAKTFESLAKHEIPAVVCYRRDVPEGIAWVDPDNQGAMYGAVEHFVQKGHTKIAHLTKRATLEFDKVERRRHFVGAVRAAGLPECAEWIFETDFFAATADLARDIMAAGVTAVVCMNDLLATDLMTAMRAEGLSVPDDLSLIGVDGLAAEEHGLTSMTFSFVDIGQCAVDALVDLIQGKPVAECCRVVPVQLVERQTVKDLHSHTD
jgi:DNA-binding LacI/PurR family transcriptional regulator